MIDLECRSDMICRSNGYEMSQIGKIQTAYQIWNANQIQNADQMWNAHELCMIDQIGEIQNAHQIYNADQIEYKIKDDWSGMQIRYDMQIKRI